MKSDYFTIGNAIYCREYYKPKKKKERGTRKYPTTNPVAGNATFRGADLLDWTMWSAALLTNPDLK